MFVCQVDPNAMSLGPGPGRSSWTRGSYSSSKKSSVQEPPALLKVCLSELQLGLASYCLSVQVGNKFAGLLDDEDEASEVVSLPSVYHGRASEPALSRNKGYRGGGRSRDYRDSSYSGPNSREGSYSGRSSREAAPVRESRDIIAEGSNNILKGDPAIIREKLEKKTTFKST